MKNLANRNYGISVNGKVPTSAILDGTEFLTDGRCPGSYRITIEHVSDDGKPLPITVVWHDPELFLIKKRRRPGRHELEHLQSVQWCLEQACSVVYELLDEDGDMRKRDTLYPDVAVAQRGVNFSTRDQNHHPAYRATSEAAKR